MRQIAIDAVNAHMVEFQRLHTIKNVSVLKDYSGMKNSKNAYAQIQKECHLIVKPSYVHAHQNFKWLQRMEESHASAQTI